MTSVAAALVHGLWHVGLAVLVGGLLLDLVILPARAAEAAAAREALRRWLAASVALLALVSVADLVVRAQAMSGAPWALVPSVLPDVVTRSHFGAVWIVRSVLLVAVAGAVAVRGPAARTLCLIAAVAVAATRNVTGHAGEWGDFTFSAGVDWVHAVAASAWTGGLLALAFVVVPAVRTPGDVLGPIAGRFSRLAGACLPAVLATGIYNAWAQLGPLAALWTTPYGRVLGVKVLGVVLLVALGTVTRYAIVPRLCPHRRGGVGVRLFRVSRLVLRGARRAGARTPTPPRLRFAEYLVAEAFVALAIFACTAALGEATPGRHQVREGRLSTHVPASKLRQAARDAAIGGAVNPPPGDAQRGRTVFLALECFACHGVRGETFPAPRQAGPDLSAVGRRHPGYLVESIVNPNALIVDGPGHTDARGASTMPDYRDRLTLRELIDLVAYLRRLDGTAAR